jgi:CTP:molybdopterin cytidylyltransferase MocA
VTPGEDMALQAGRVVPLILAAGSATRFGSPKLVAPLGGRPLIGHVLAAIADVGLDRPVVVVGASGDLVRSAVDAEGVDWATNPDPTAGLSSSLRVGLAAVRGSRPDAEAILVLLGDQPRVRPEVIEQLIAAAAVDGPPLVAPRYGGDGGHNPVLARRAGWPLVDETTGDRGIGPLLASHPDLVAWVEVEGDNPDVDTPVDLEALEALEAREALGRRSEGRPPPP